MGRKRVSRSLNGIKRVYWINNQWQYKCTEAEKAIAGRFHIPLGAVDSKAVRAYANFKEKIGKPSGEMNYLFDEYLIECRSTLKPVTVDAKLQEMKRLRVTFGHMHAAEITPQHVQRFYTARWRESPTQANHELSTLNAAMRFGVTTLGLLPTNPCREIKRRSVPSRKRLPTKADISAVKKHGDDFVRGVLDFIYITGCVRRGDICGLQRADFNEEGYRPVTHKGGKKGFVPWTPQLRESVRLMQSRNPIESTVHLVLGHNGKPLGPSAYNKRIATAMNKALASGDLKERFNPHDIRATHAVEAERAGLNATDQLLHGDQKTTKVYLRDKKETRITPLYPDE